MARSRKTWLPILTHNYPWVNSVSQAPAFFDPANDANKVAGIIELLSDISDSHPSSSARTPSDLKTGDRGVKAASRRRPPRS
jgi:hypothetical protein